MSYKKNTGGLWLCPDPTLLEKVFMPTRDILKEIDSQTNFQLHEFYKLFSH